MNQNSSHNYVGSDLDDFCGSFAEVRWMDSNLIHNRAIMGKPRSEVCQHADKVCREEVRGNTTDNFDFKRIRSFTRSHKKKSIGENRFRK